MSAASAPVPTGQPADLSALCAAIAEHVPLAMATIQGPMHIVRYANTAFCRLMDQPIELLAGRSLDELLPKNGECVALLDRVFHTGKSAIFTEQEPMKPHPVFWSYTIWPVVAKEGLRGS